MLFSCNFVLFILFFTGALSDSFMFLSYATRPLWDSPPPSFELVPHYYAEGVPMEILCQLHGWTHKDSPNKVVDAVIFANELDLLEIRIRELLPVVDKFFIVEADKTFTNKPKPTVFFDNRDRFRFAEDKIVYAKFVSPPVTEEEAMGFTLENGLRDFMTDLLRKNGLAEGDVLIMADVDEIPSRHTIELFRNCDGFPSDLHLGMKNYLYSFEFPITHQAGYLDSSSPNSYQWRPQIHRWHRGVAYRHGRSSNLLFADAGWHCSFCFRYLSDFVFKMTSYSHSDRVRYQHFLDHQRIQRVICEGADMFDMPSESFTFYDLLLNWYPPVKTTSMVHLPVALVEYANRFEFLLPGHCLRED